MKIGFTTHVVLIRGKNIHKHAMLVDPVTEGPQTCKNIFLGALIRFDVYHIISRAV